MVIGIKSITVSSLFYPTTYTIGDTVGDFFITYINTNCSVMCADKDIAVWGRNLTKDGGKILYEFAINQILGIEYIR